MKYLNFYIKKSCFFNIQKLSNIWKKKKNEKEFLTTHYTPTTWRTCKTVDQNHYYLFGMLLKLYKIQGSKTIVKLVCLYYNPGIFSDLNLVMKCVHFLVTIKNLQSWLSKQKVTKRPMGCITHLSNNSKYQLYAIIYKMSGQWSKIIRSSTKRFSYFSGLFDFEKSF